jgi:hypothetical protein
VPARPHDPDQAIAGADGTPRVPAGGRLPPPEVPRGAPVWLHCPHQAIEGADGTPRVPAGDRRPPPMVA